DEAFAVEPPSCDIRVDEKVAQAVQALPPLQREVLILIEYEGLTLEEAAHAVAAELGTVKARLHRARNNLRRVLEPLRSANHER
ncbi:MAG: sigma factor-like helix-turn-helix DNA-binding protein, partial [Bryobacteraceae bacterium]